MGKSQTVSSVQPGIFPIGRAVALLGVAEAALAGRRLVVEGRRVVAVRFGRWALLVAYVDAAEFAPAEVERRRTQALWLRNEARIHERAVERASAHAALLPARLLSIFPHPAALEKHASDSDARWTRALSRTGSKRECVLHVFRGPHVPPGGEPYLIRVTSRSSRSRRVPALEGSADVVRHVRALWDACAARAVATRRIAVSGSRGALFASALLVAEDVAQALPAIIERFAEAGSALGIAAHLEGPRLPFSFV